MRVLPAAIGVAVLVVLTLLFVVWGTESVERGVELGYETAEFGGVSLRLEYARTPGERERGLSGRESIPSDYGMLFVFSRDDRYGFWMKDTLVPLDIFWLDAQGLVVSMALEVATSSYPNVFYPTQPARYVLETAAGFARAHDIATGTPLVLKNWPRMSQ